MTRYPYHTEPIRPALIQAGVLSVLAILVPLSLVRVVLLAAGVGALVWAWLQWRRGKHGVGLADDALIVQHALTGHVWHIPYATMLGVTVSPRDGLIVAHQRLLVPPPPTATPTVALMRPEPTTTRLTITPTLSDPAALLAELLTRLPAAPTISAQTLLQLARGRRRRGWLLLLLAILGIPFYMYMIWRLIPLLR